MTNFPETPTAQEHIHEDRLLVLAFANASTAASEATHLARCTDCRARLQEYALLERELLVAKLSEPSAAAQQRYAAMFEHARVNATGIVERLAQFADAVKASVMWNGHARLAADGVRSASTTSYRMLYGTEQAEIELLVEPVGGHFKIEGELLPLQGPEAALPVWLELYQADGHVSFSGESDGEGRFHIPAMAPGEYALYLVPPVGSPMLIEALELS